LEIDQLLIELAEPGFDFLEIVREALDLRGHGVETGAGVGLNVLNRLLEGVHRGVELVDGVGGLLDQGFLDSVVLRHLGLKIVLPCEESGDVALQLDDLASDGEGGFGADKAAGECAEKHGAREDEDVASTHDGSSKQ